jgi:NAD(P)-dependent dehydrogenase (short-subunit alcohol dehydrogenase family)
MVNRTILLLGASSDIGKSLAETYLANGDTVIGTYRDGKSIDTLPRHPRAHFLHCDVGSPQSIRGAVERVARLGLKWDVFVSAVGTLEPIGKFFDTNFDEWEQSLIVNSSAQLRFLHGTFHLRKSDSTSHVVFFAGGGTNNAFTNFSAYCLSKIMLIKMCELLDDENQDLNVFIVGPGWVRTKIHNHVINSGRRSGESLQKTEEFLKSNSQGTSYEDIFRCIEWCIEKGKKVAGGRNFSVVHDAWKDESVELSTQLLRDPNQFKLRRRDVRMNP